MRVKIRFYRAHDFDLISLYQAMEGMKFQNLVRDILHAYVEGQLYKPPDDLPLSRDLAIGDGKKPPICHISIKDENEKEVELLNRIVEGKRGAFLKLLCRAYLFNFLAPAYFTDQGARGNCWKRIASQASGYQRPDIRMPDDAEQYLLNLIRKAQEEENRRHIPEFAKEKGMLRTEPLKEEKKILEPEKEVPADPAPISQKEDTKPQRSEESGELDELALLFGGLTFE